MHLRTDAEIREDVVRVVSAIAYDVDDTGLVALEAGQVTPVA
ncbi:hypothetical protein AB0873_19660 [Micromonospora sp. NPDC047707]